jgi:probable F420-dependent oxidoreductase
VKLGVHLPQFGADPATILRVARRAEDAGYASLWVSDHLLAPDSGGALPPIELLEPVTLLAWVAQATSTIRLGTSVLVVPYRNPIHLAKELATLESLAPGRVIAGLASGWLEPEFRALGAPFERRGEFTDEAIRLMRECWSNPSPSFSGRFFTLAGMRFGPRPPSGRIPIWIGGTSRRALRRAVELGDGWHGTRMRPDDFATRLDWLRDIAARAGRDLDGLAITHRVYVGFAERWTETGGYIDGILAPPSELAGYLNRFAALGVAELLITPIGPAGSLDDFLDRFDRDVRPRLA